MTITIAANSFNDMALNSSGNISFLTGIDACVQNCHTAMQTLQGEMMYNQQGGMPYQTTAWDNFDQNLFDAAAQAVLLNVQDVTDIIEFSSALVDGVLNYSATIKTIYGTVPL